MQKQYFTHFFFFFFAKINDIYTYLQVLVFLKKKQTKFVKEKKKQNKQTNKQTKFK